MVSVEFLSIRNICLPRYISAARRRELWDPIEDIERFIVVMYSRKCPAIGGNEAGKELFAQCSRTMENISPTKAALQHVRRAAYQLGCVWSQALTPVLPSPALWGGSHLIRNGNPFGLNYQRRPQHATNVYTADARRAAGASANAVHRIYSAQNFANVAEHAATTCSSWRYVAIFLCILHRIPFHCLYF